MSIFDRGQLSPNEGPHQPEDLDDAIARLEDAGRLGNVTLAEASGMLADAWDRFWSEEVSVFVSQAGEQATATPGVSFQELINDKSLEFESRVYSAEGGIRRISRRLEFDTFLEDRSFSEFRTNLAQTLDRLREDLRGAKDTAAEVERTLSKLSHTLVATLTSTPREDLERVAADTLDAIAKRSSAAAPLNNVTDKDGFVLAVRTLARVDSLRTRLASVIETVRLRHTDPESSSNVTGALSEASRALGTSPATDVVEPANLCSALITLGRELGVADAVSDAQRLEERFVTARCAQDNIRKLVGKQKAWSLADVYQRDWKEVQERGPVAVSLLRIEELLRTLADQDTRYALYEAAFKVHTEVQGRWGTWTRRVRKPIGDAVVMFAFLLILYRTLGGYLPLEPLFFLVFAIAAMQFALSYRASEDQIRSRSSQLNNLLRPLLPQSDAHAAGFSDNFWTADPKAIMKGVRQKLLKQSGLTPVKASHGTPTLAGSAEVAQPRGGVRRALTWLLAAVRDILSVPVKVLVFALGMYAFPALVWTFLRPPEVYVTVAEGRTCTDVLGHIAWPGPTGLVLRSSANAFDLSKHVSLDAARVLAVHYGAPGPTACQDVSPMHLTLGSSTTTYVIGEPSIEKLENRSTILIPFPVGKIACNADLEKHPAARPDKPYNKSLKEIAKLLVSCSNAKFKPIIDVRGYASSSQFECQQKGLVEDRNEELADRRRKSVLAIMAQAEPDFTSRVEVHRLEGPRWRENEKVRQTSLELFDRVVGDRSPEKQREYLSRHVELEVIYIGDCANPPK
jgi:hypothetical protein